MKIRMLSTAASESGVIQAGSILSAGVDITQETAIAWLNAGYAESIKEQIEQAIVEPKETAINGASTSKRASKRTTNNRRG